MACFCAALFFAWHGALAAQFGDFSYSTAGSGVTITLYTGPGGAVDIPPTIDELPVVNIGNGAFSGASDTLTGITIPGSVTNVGDMAFHRCSQLAHVTLPGKVANIGSQAFADCYNLTTVTILGNVTNLANYAFMNCTNLLGVYCKGHAPQVGLQVFQMDNQATVYRVAGTTGWGATLGGRPTALWTPPVYALTVANGSGSGSYSEGTTVNIVAHPAPSGQAFDCWTGATDCVANARSAATVATMPDRSIALTAAYLPVVTVSAVANPPGAGAVTGSGTYVVGRSAQLSATAGSFWRFLDWNDGNTQASRSIVVPATNVTYTANFARLAMVTVLASPVMGGAVSGGGIFLAGSNVTLTAAAAPDWIFARWNDGDTNAVRSLTVPPSNTVWTATFTLRLDKALNASEIPWTTGGDAAWYGQVATMHDGQHAARSGPVGGGQQSWMQTTVTGPGSLLFWWKASSEPNDYLEFYAYTATQTQAVARLSGNADWQNYVAFLSTTNTYTLKWRYVKDGSLSGGSDAGWVDEVTWIPCPYAAHAPQLFFQNSSGLLASWILNSTGGFEFARILANTGGWALKAAGDIDGDGVSDLLFQTPANDTGGWFMNADGSYRDARFWWNTGGWEIKACADYDGVGRAQVFFQTAGGLVAYWRLDTNGVFQSAVVLGNMGSWKLRGGGDIDGDGKAELFWQNAAGAVAIWYHNPDDSIRGVVPFTTGVWALRGVTDVDADGVSDLLWQTPDLRTGGWFMNADGTFRDARFWWPTPGWQLKAAGR